MLRRITRLTQAIMFTAGTPTREELFRKLASFLGVDLSEKETLGELEELEELELHRAMHRRMIIAETIEKGLATAVWEHRKMTVDAQSFYVTSVCSRTVEESAGQYWLFVELTEVSAKLPPFQIVLHQFLEECQPLGDLTFYDWDA